MRGRAGSAALAALVLVGVTACSGSSSPAAAPAVGVATPSSRPTVAGTDASTDPATTPEPEPGTPSSTGTPTSSPTTAAPSATPTGTAPTSSPGATRWPTALGEPGQGDPVWAVYLALAHSSDDPAVDRALRAAASVGYTAVQGDLACDHGAIEALGLDQYDYWSAVTVYFATQREAADFTASYQAKVGKTKGTARVDVGCLD